MNTLTATPALFHSVFSGPAPHLLWEAIYQKVEVKFTSPCHTHHGEAHPTPQLPMSQGPLEASTWCNKHSTTILGSIFLGLIAPGSTHVSAGLQFWKNEVRIPFSLFSDYFTNGLKKLPSRWRRQMDKLWSSGHILLWAYVSLFSFIFTFRQQPHCYNVVTELTVSNEPLLNRAISPLHSVFHLRVLLGHHLAEIPTQGVQSINSFNSYAAHFHSTGHNVCSLGNVPGIFRRFFLLTENFPASRVRSHLLLSATFMVLKLQGNRA